MSNQFRKDCCRLEQMLNTETQLKLLPVKQTLLEYYTTKYSNEETIKRKFYEKYLTILKTITE